MMIGNQAVGGKHGGSRRSACRHWIHLTAPAAKRHSVGEMLDGKKVTVVMPAYNAALTLERTLQEINREIVDDLILVDDASHDTTVEVARRLGLRTIVHDSNRGYGGNQKTCYAEALRTGADVVVMLHPDYQYTPKLITAIASLIAVDQFDCVLGSRILSGGALKGGMPLYKYVANRALTAIENLVTGAKLSEYHTGYRGFSRKLLETLPLEENSDDFVFDAQMLAQCLYFGFRIGEVSCPTRYEPESSSINFRRSVVYGVGVLATTALYRACKSGVMKHPIFDGRGRRLDVLRPHLYSVSPQRESRG
jgi:glycosyltransferase involved in cell wall biosynthesis